MPASLSERHARRRGPESQFSSVRGASSPRAARRRWRRPAPPPCSRRRWSRRRRPFQQLLDQRDAQVAERVDDHGDAFSSSSVAAARAPSGRARYGASRLSSAARIWARSDAAAHGNASSSRGAMLALQLSSLAALQQLQQAGCSLLNPEGFETAAKLGTRCATTARDAERNRNSAYARGGAAHALHACFHIFAASVASHTSRGKAGSSP